MTARAFRPLEDKKRRKEVGKGTNNGEREEERKGRTQVMLDREEWVSREIWGVGMT